MGQPAGDTRDMAWVSLLQEIYITDLAYVPLLKTTASNAKWSHILGLASSDVGGQIYSLLFPPHPPPNTALVGQAYNTEWETHSPDSIRVGPMLVSQHDNTTTTITSCSAYNQRMSIILKHRNKCPDNMYRLALIMHILQSSSCLTTAWHSLSP